MNIYYVPTSIYVFNMPIYDAEIPAGGFFFPKI